MSRFCCCNVCRNKDVFFVTNNVHRNMSSPALLTARWRNPRPLSWWSASIYSCCDAAKHALGNLLLKTHLEGYKAVTKGCIQIEEHAGSAENQAKQLGVQPGLCLHLLQPFGLSFSFFAGASVAKYSRPGYLQQQASSSTWTSLASQSLSSSYLIPWSLA